MNTFEYMTSALTGHVHLVRPFRERAICGAAVRPDWTMGDETVSGIRATCSRCLDLRPQPGET